MYGTALTFLLSSVADVLFYRIENSDILRGFLVLTVLYNLFIRSSAWSAPPSVPATPWRTVTTIPPSTLHHRRRYIFLSWNHYTSRVMIFCVCKSLRCDGSWILSVLMRLSVFHIESFWAYTANRFIISCHVSPIYSLYLK
jgi:hypothetical protein